MFSHLQKGETTATNVVFALFAFGTQPSETLILVLYDDKYIIKYALFSIKTLGIQSLHINVLINKLNIGYFSSVTTYMKKLETVESTLFCNTVMFQGCILVYKSPHFKAYTGHSITAISLETFFPQNSQSMLAHI